MNYKKAVSLETIVTIAVIGIIFGYLCSVMGAGNMFSTLMKTAHELLLDTVFFILAISVVAGAFSSVLAEFGVVSLLNVIISPIMRPLYRLPGAASVGIVTTFLSDNPAIIPLAKQENFTRFFRNYEIPALCNLGTAFGMGLIISTFMIAQGNEYIPSAIIGILGTVVGSIVSVNIMLVFTRKYYNIKKGEHPLGLKGITKEVKDSWNQPRQVREGKAVARAFDAILDGGKSGVEMGMSIIPGVLIICTFVLMFTFGPADAVTGYTGAAFEGVRLLPKIGQVLSPVLTPLFGLSSPELLAFPVTSLGAAGAAIGLIPNFIKEGLITPKDIAVLTAFGMCWSGYLSTHVGMMDALGVRNLAGKAIISHTIGGLVAATVANYIFMLFSLIVG